MAAKTVRAWMVGWARALTRLRAPRLTGQDHAATGRRAFVAAAVGLGATVGGMAAGPAQAGAIRRSIRWVHGNSATVVDDQGLERDRIDGNARVVHGRSWSTIPLHFAVPTPFPEPGRPIRVTAVWLRLKAEAGACVSAMTVHDCEQTLAHVGGVDIRRDDWDDVRVGLDPPCVLHRSLGVTVECAFADVGRQIGVSAIGCEFEIVA